MTTTIAPVLGHGILETQQGIGATPGYDAIDDRRAWSPGKQEGVLSAGSYEVTQRGAGANMSVDIAASVGDGALVNGEAVAVQGLYRVPPHSAVINEAVTAAHATLPRIDIIVLELKDHQHDASGSNLAQTRVIAGTATSGATLANRTGAAALPSSAVLLADILVGAAAASITNAVIRDRRPWALGAYCRIVRNQNAAAGNDYTSSTGAICALIDATNLNPRIECSGVPIRVSLRGSITCSVGNSLLFSPQVDSVGVDGMGNVGAAIGSSSLSHAIFDANTNQVVGFDWTFVPAAGSHRIGPGWAAQSGTAFLMLARAALPMTWTVEEILRPNTPNNITTTG